MNNINKKKIEYVIGIDLGHGETSAAICPMQWDTDVKMLEPTKDLEMGGNKKVLPSAITILNDGKAYIGDAAFNPEILKQAKVRVCFKQAPKNINGEAEQLMIRFMHEVYVRIRENNSGMLTDTNHLVYIATPSGWDYNTQQLYVEMARQAGLPIGGVTKESRAAFVRAQHDVTSGLGRNIHKGAIVFDMGSSTLDFTYMNNEIKGLIDHGYDCGASFVEKSIYKEQEETDKYIQLFEKKYPDLVDYLVFEARKVKEQVYFDPTLRVKKSINFDDFIEDEDLEDERFKLTFKPGELNEHLLSNGYLKQIEGAMLDYKNNHIAGQKIYGVFMTGGASRMDFLRPMICKCWGVTEEQIYRDQDPSLTISQGVAEVARMDLRTDGMDVGLKESINNIKQSGAIYESFTMNFGGALYERITENIASRITEWAESSQNYNLNVLQSMISSAVQKSINYESSNITQYIEQAIDESTADVRQKVEDIVSHYSNQGVNIQLPTLNINNINVSGINLNGIMDEISNSIAVESSNWSSTIAGAAVGGAVAMILGGPLMWIIGGGALLGKYFFGKEESEAEKKRKAMTKNLSSDERAQVYATLSEKWDEMTDNIAASIRESLDGNRNIKSSINQAVNGMLDSYEQSLKNARILID